jgi:DNA-binding response OmpR family regulator
MVEADGTGSERRPTLVLVEDDPAFSYAAARALERGGFEVLGFPDFRGAIEMLESGRRVDLLILDIKLGTNTPHGLSLARMARFRRPGIPLLFVTGFADSIDLGDLGDLGKVLRKPIELADLVEEARRAMGRARPAAVAPDAAGGPARVLVVAEDARIAGRIEDLLHGAGHAVVGPILELGSAIDAAAHDALDAALIDLELHGEKATSVAHALRRRGIPFALISVQGPDSPTLPPDLREERVLAKPLLPEELMDALAGLLRRTPDPTRG